MYVRTLFLRYLNLYVKCYNLKYSDLDTKLTEAIAELSDWIMV